MVCVHYLYCLVAPAHNLAGADVRHGSGHLAPLSNGENNGTQNIQITEPESWQFAWGSIQTNLQNDILRDASVRVHVDAFVVVAQQQLHAVGVGQGHDTVRYYRSLRL